MSGGALLAGLSAGADLGISEGGVGSLFAARFMLSSLQSSCRMSARPGTPAVMPPAVQALCLFGFVDKPAVTTCSSLAQ